MARRQAWLAAAASGAKTLQGRHALQACGLWWQRVSRRQEGERYRQGAAAGRKGPPGCGGFQAALHRSWNCERCGWSAAAICPHLHYSVGKEDLWRRCGFDATTYCHLVHVHLNEHHHHRTLCQTAARSHRVQSLPFRSTRKEALQRDGGAQQAWRGVWTPGRPPLPGEAPGWPCAPGWAGCWPCAPGWARCWPCAPDWARCWPCAPDPADGWWDAPGLTDGWWPAPCRCAPAPASLHPPPLHREGVELGVEAGVRRQRERT